MAETKINTVYMAVPPPDAGNNPACVFSARTSIAHMDEDGDIDRMCKVPYGVTILGWDVEFKDLDTDATPAITISGYIHSPLGEQADLQLFSNSTVPQTGGAFTSHVGPTDAAAAGIGTSERATIGAEITSSDAEVRFETTTAADVAVTTARYSIVLWYYRTG